MGNCLVTKLKSVVNNDNLDRLGSLRMFIEPRSNNDSYSLAFNLGSSPRRISIIGNTNTVLSVSPSSLGTMVDSHTVDWKGTENSAAGLTIYTQSNDLTTVDIEGEYELERLYVLSLESANLKYGIEGLPSNIKYIFIEGYSGSINTSDFVHITGLKRISLANSSYTIEGQLSAFNSLTDLESLNIAGINNTITGEVKDVGSLTKLTTFKFSATVAITGSLEEFVAAQRIAGRTAESKGIDFGWGFNNITFNGASSYRGHSSTLTWTADTITYDGVTISA